MSQPLSITVFILSVWSAILCGADVAQESLSKRTLGSVYPVTQGYLDPAPEHPTAGNIHAGVDVGAPRETLVRAAFPGLVIHVGPPRPMQLTCGGRAEQTNLSTFAVYDGHNTAIYLHMTDLATALLKQEISAGTIIGKVGREGACAPHLHIEVRRGRNELAVGSRSQGKVAEITLDPITYSSPVTTTPTPVTPRPSPQSEAAAFAAAYWNSKFTKCGDSYYTRMIQKDSLTEYSESLGDLVEVKDLSWSVEPRPISAVDKLNGLEWEGRSVLRATAHRRYDTAAARGHRSTWTAWMAELWPSGEGFGAGLARIQGDTIVLPMRREQGKSFAIVDDFMFGFGQSGRPLYKYRGLTCSEIPGVGSQTGTGLESSSQARTAVDSGQTPTVKGAHISAVEQDGVFYVLGDTSGTLRQLEVQTAIFDKTNLTFGVAGPQSPVRLREPKPEFLIRLASNGDPRSYPLYRLQSRGERRVVFFRRGKDKQLQTIPGQLLGWNWASLGDNLYKFTPAAPLGRGEYGFSPTGSDLVFLFSIE